MRQRTNQEVMHLLIEIKTLLATNHDLDSPYYSHIKIFLDDYIKVGQSEINNDKFIDKVTNKNAD